MAIDTSKFAVQQIFVVDAFSLEDGSLIARLEDLKTSSLSNNGTVVYAQGGVGNPKIIGFSHSKESTLEIENAVITDGAIGIQTGQDVVTLTNATTIPYDEVVTATTADTVVISFPATGTVGSELQYAYLLNADGTVGKKFTQTTGSAGEGTFTYASATRTLTFDEGAVPAGSRVMVVYYPTISTARQISNSTESFAMNVRLNCKTLFRDTCTGKDYVGLLVIYKAKASEEWNLELSADGDPAVHNISFEALKSCESPVLWDIFIYNDEDIEAAEPAPTEYTITNNASSAAVVGSSTDKYAITAVNVNDSPSNKATAGATVKVTVTSTATSTWADDGKIKVIATRTTGGTTTVTPTDHAFTATGQTQEFTFSMPESNVTLTLEYTAGG